MKTAQNYSVFNAPDSDYDYGTFKNEESLGAKDGTKIQADIFDDMKYAMLAVLKEANITPTGVTENTNGENQLLDAIKVVATDIASGLASQEYIALSSGTLPLTQSTNGTYTYYLSDFDDGSGALETGKIRGVHVQCFAFGGDSHDVRVNATYPGDATPTRVICRSHGNNGDDDCGSGATVFVPINSGQTTVAFSLSGGQTSLFEIIGASVFG